MKVILDILLRAKLRSCTPLLNVYITGLMEDAQKDCNRIMAISTQIVREGNGTNESGIVKSDYRTHIKGTMKTKCKASCVFNTKKLIP